MYQNVRETRIEELERALESLVNEFDTGGERHCIGVYVELDDTGAETLVDGYVTDTTHDVIEEALDVLYNSHEEDTCLYRFTELAEEETE